MYKCSFIEENDGEKKSRKKRVIIGATICIASTIIAILEIGTITYDGIDVKDIKKDDLRRS